MPDPGLPDLALARVRDARSGRVSSWDQRGRNQDMWAIGPMESRVIADLEGPGAITHIWMTQFARRDPDPWLIDAIRDGYAAPESHPEFGNSWGATDPDYYRKVLLRVTYDGAANPSILVPLGDFFGVGHSMPANYASEFFTVTAAPGHALKFGGSASLNSYLPMPFREHVKVELVNENDVPYGQFFHVDYELYRQPMPEDTGYLHASWRRSDPCPGWGPDLRINSHEVNAPNLSGDGNYVVLDTRGTGHYLGAILSVYQTHDGWWGEGDDMIFIDDDVWPPSIHGTGTEDYFNHAWGMQRQAYPWHGSIIHSNDVPGYSVSYRFHGPDPVRFSERIRVTIEHGHANHLSDDWASIAYWYQLPPFQRLTILPVAERLPHRPTRSGTDAPAPPPADIEAEVRAQRSASDALRREYLKRMEQHLAERLQRTARDEQANKDAARALRERFR